MREAIIGIAIGMVFALLVALCIRTTCPAVPHYMPPPPDCARTSPPWGTADCYARP
jgi:hypothetical protein